MFKPVKKCNFSVFLICVSQIKIIFLMKKYVKKMRKMSIFESFFSQSNQITIIITIFLVNFNFNRFLQFTIKRNNVIQMLKKIYAINLINKYLRILLNTRGDDFLLFLHLFEFNKIYKSSVKRYNCYLISRY